MVAYVMSVRPVTSPNAHLQEANDLKKDILGIIMAGGKSSRLGQDKTRIVIENRQTLLKKNYYLLNSLLKTCFVSCKTQSFNQDLPCIYDESEYTSPLSGLISSLNYAKKQNFSAIFVIACDLPFIQKSLLKKLYITYQENKDNFILWTFYNPRLNAIEPLVSIYSCSSLNYLEKALAQKHFKLFDLIPLEQQKRIPYTKEEEQMFFNINTQNDLIKAKTIINNL